MPIIEAASFKKSNLYQWRSKGGGGILDKLYVIICLNYFDQLLLDYIAYLLIVNHLTVLLSAQAQSCRSGPRHLVYALVYSRKYKKDLILMCIMSQLRTVFFVFALFESLTLSMRMQYRHGCSLLSLILAKLLLLDINSKCFCPVYSDCQ